MQPPEDLKERPKKKKKKKKTTVGVSNSPTQGISGLLEKLLTPIVSCLKTYINDDCDFIRKVPLHFHHPCVLASFDVVIFYTSIPHDLRLEALSYWIDKKRSLMPERFTKAFIVEAVLFVLSKNNVQYDIYVFAISWYCNGHNICSTLCMS